MAFNLKRILIVFISIGFLSLNVYANESPVIDFDGELIRKSDNYLYYYFSSKNSFKRNLGKSQSEILTSFLKYLSPSIYPDYPVKELKSNGNYELYTIKYDTRLTYKNKATYILKNGICVGYIINAPVQTTKFQDWPVVLQIKSLNQNNNYLTITEEINENLKEVKVFENKANDYTERYVLVSKSQAPDDYQEFIISYSFYPDELESLILAETNEYVNLNLEYIKNSAIGYDY